MDDDNGTPHYMRGFIRGQYNVFYINGDLHHRGIRVLVNRKYYPSYLRFLDHLTERLEPRYGSVRCLRTPNHGHRVHSMDDLRPNAEYVAVGPEMKLRAYGYGEIDPNHRKKSPTRDKNELPGEPNRRYQVSGRSKKLPIQGTMFKCCVNGRGQEGSRVVVLPPRRNHPDKVEEVINCVSGVMADKCGGPVDKLYLPTGVKVMDMNMICSNQLYVAVKCGDSFRPGPYSEFCQRGLSFSPKLERKRLPPLPYSNKTSSHSSPEHSMTSRNGFRRDRERERERARRREEQSFNPPPRQRSKKQRYVDYDQDNGGVFKSKSQNRATRGAREVDDSRYTRVDLPIDQREAEPVHDEEMDNYHAHNGWKDDADKAPAATQERDRTHRPNARRANSPSNEQANREKEREARERRQTEDRARAEKQRQQQEAMRRKRKERDEQKKKEEEEERKKKEEERKRKQEEERKRKEEERRKREEEEEEKKKRRKAEERRKEQERAVDLRTSTPDRPQEHNRAGEEELAATKIQAGFRGARARREVKAMRAEKDVNEDRYQSPSPIPLAGTESPHHHNHHDDHYQSSNAQQEEWAATKIQAGYRGYRERQDLKKSKEDEQEGGRYSRYEEPAPVLGEEDWGMVPAPDHNDGGEQERAAVKIQAGFRGAKARQQVKAMRDEKEVKERQETTPPPSSPPRPASKDPSQTRTVSPIDDGQHTDADAAHNDDSDDTAITQLDAEHAAATKIQAAFRGQQTRKELAQAQAAPAGEREDGAEGGEENGSRD